MTTLTADAVEPQPQPVEDKVTGDGWYNELTGMARAMNDKREADRLCMQSLSYDTCMAAYQSSWLAARIVDKPAEDMTREGFEVEIKDSADGGEAVGDYLEQLDIECITEQGLKWSRLFGGGLVLIGANDGQADLSQPLNEKALKSIDYLNVFDASEARPVTWQDNPAAEGYGEPIMWCITPWVIGQEQARTDVTGGLAAMVKGQGAQQIIIPAMRYIHASRVFPFFGTKISRRHDLMSVNPGINGRGWGDGVLARCIKLIRDFEGAWDGAAFQLREFSQAIYSISGLAQAIASDKSSAGNSYAQKRMRTIEMSRSMIRAVMLDKDGEKFERNDAAMTGVADTLREFATVLAAAADIPVSILMGAQGGGLGASGSGQNDVQNWYSAVKAKQMKTLKPFFMELTKLIVKCQDFTAKGIKMKPDADGTPQPQGVKVAFRSLYQLTDAEQATIYLQMAQADAVYVGLGTISNEDIAKARFSGKPPKVFLIADPTELAAREDQAQEMQDVTHETTVNNLQEHGTPTPPPPPKEAPPKAGK